MRKEEQTSELLKRLNFLTVQFTRALQPRYYYQFTGDINDLSSEIFRNFITPKSRVKGKEETLLDKFDPSITSLEYLVKVSVKNALIDQSRMHPVRFRSIDSYIEEYGDSFLRTFNLTTESLDDTVDSREFSPTFVKKLKKQFASLSLELRQSFKRQYESLRSVFSENYQKLFDSFINESNPYYVEVSIDGYPDDFICQQITPKTVCVLMGDSVYNFDRFSGKCKHPNMENYCLSDKQLDLLKSIPEYKSGYSREEIVSYYLA